MAYDFFSFNGETFEQFVRAVAISVLGPGVTAFGNGPDGGREATFSSKVSYPSPPADCWNGYGVIQAKCKESHGSTAQNQAWAIDQLKKELSAFVTSSQRSPKPEYYIFATNISLSSAVGGGKDSADDLLRSFYGPLSMRGHSIWDSNQLSAFIDSYAELRRRFKAYISSGDVLYEILTSLDRQHENTDIALTTYLQRELRADVAARLDQAGHRIDEQIQLSNVFFDLPTSPLPSDQPPNDEFDSSIQLPSGVLSELLSAGALRLDPRSLSERQSAATGTNDDLFLGRYVLIGGPGSGKSTVGQYLAQIHRAALLLRRPAYLLDPRVVDVIASIRKNCERDSLPWPTTPRFPFRVDLNRFAKAIAANDGNALTLGQYLLELLNSATAFPYETLLEWMRSYPVLLVLDGLDEVPVSSNRKEMMAAIDDFLGEIRQLGADVLTIATTRPQGYEGEFGTKEVTSRYVLPLSVNRALQYASRYAAARFGDNRNERERVIEQLTQSAKHELTQRLMRSPLQITFMATVVAARGRPGESRWQLFSGYYRTIYDRELQKAVPPFNEVLSQQQATIDRLHHDIGFLLQLRGEREGQTDATISIREFEALTKKCLRDDGWNDDAINDLCSAISGAAHSRLVFLTSRVEGQLSFDVRSLQEYMASECLMTGGVDEVIGRLRLILPTSYWRNTLQFAFGKAFSDAQSRHFRAPLVLLCDELHSTGGDLFEKLSLGAKLAIDVVESGAVAQHPNAEQHLTELALKGIDRCSSASFGAVWGYSEGGVVGLYKERFKSLYKNAIELRIGQKELDKALTGWHVLIALTEREVEWAEGLASKDWPSDPASQLQILESYYAYRYLGRWLEEKIVRAVFANSPSDTQLVLVRVASRERALYSSPALRAAGRVATFHLNDYLTAAPIRLPNGQITSLCVRYVSCYSDRASSLLDCLRSIAMVEECHPEWKLYAIAAAFLERPCRATLLQACSEYANLSMNGGELPRCLPWPLANALAVSRKVTQDELVFRVNNGWFGNEEVWRASEEEWARHGVPIFVLANESIGLKELAGLADIPGYGMRFDASERNCENVDAIRDALLSLPTQSWVRAQLTWTLLSTNKPLGEEPSKIGPSSLREMLASELIEQVPLELVLPQSESLKSSHEWVEFVDWFGRSTLLVPTWFGPRESDMAAVRRIILLEYMKDDTKIGLLHVAASMFISRSLLSSQMPTVGELSEANTPRKNLSFCFLS